MPKYVGVQVPIFSGSTATGAAIADSGTTDGAVAGKLTQSGQNFLTTVSVGDYVFVNASGISGFPIRSFAKVSAVDSDTALSLSGAALPATGTGGLSASGTAYIIVAAANVFKGELSGAKFLSALRAGDMVVNTTTKINTKISKVVSDTELELERAGMLVNGDDFFVLSDREDGPNRLVRVDNATLIRGNASNGQTTIHYKRGATNQKLAIDLGDAPSSAYDVFSTAFKEAAEEVMQSRWSYSKVVMPYTESDGTQGIQWGQTFTFS
jgi:hypothetical protein|tara:strand:- start:503 stop:1303 length:801 start_codon:yes stop_codon:yes gene_type:complete